jgi:hypothetical protein
VATVSPFTGTFKSQKWFKQMPPRGGYTLVLTCTHRVQIYNRVFIGYVRARYIGDLIRDQGLHRFDVKSSGLATLGALPALLLSLTRVDDFCSAKSCWLYCRNSVGSLAGPSSLADSVASANVGSLSDSGSLTDSFALTILGALVALGVLPTRLLQ